MSQHVGEMKLEIVLSSQQQGSIVRKWLGLAVASLLAAGVFSLLLVLSRTPGVQDFIPWVDFFHVALVVHVDLSVLIWFLSMAGAFWTASNPDSGGYMDRLAWNISAVGALMMVACPFFGVGDPLMNNYVPVLQHPAYYLALGLFGLGIFLLLLGRLRVLPGPINNGQALLAWLCYLSALPTLLSMFALVLSFLSIPSHYEGEYYFELLFWGAGHTLQFTHTLLLLGAWLWLASACGARTLNQPRILFLLSILVILPIVFVPWIYASVPVDSVEHRLDFTRLMQYGGLACMPLGLIAVWQLAFSPRAKGLQKPIKSAFIASGILFTAGGIIGFLIEGVNVVIPAHYHGSIVGVTLSFMGVAYLLMPKLGLGAPDIRLASIQPYVYGGGQLMHILGLAWSGGYGVQRKTAGAAQGLERLPEILGMGMMGLGGLISTIGGLLFLIVIIKAWRSRPTTI
jgi:cytochrome c oxidase subunit I